MTTGTIIFLVLIAALVLVLGVAVIWQCCNIRNLIDESAKESRNDIYETYNSLRDLLVEYVDELKKDLSSDSENASKSRGQRLDLDSTRSLRDCLEDICKFYGIPVHLLARGMQEAGKELNLKSESVSKSGLRPESTTPKGTITPPSSFSDIELRKYCIEQTRKDQVYLRIEDAQRLYDYILNGNQRGKEVTNEH